MFEFNNGKKEQAKLDEKKWFDRQVNKAATLTDPVKRVQWLEVTKAVINAKIKAKNTEKQNKLRSTNKLVQYLSMMPATFALIAAMVIGSTSGGILLPAALAVAGVVGFIYGTDKIASSTQKHLESKNREFTDILENQKNILSRKAVRVMKDNIGKITESQKRDKILEFPDLNQAFKSITKDETPILAATHFPISFYNNRPGI
ncbi:MAG: hypothetical protein KAI76_09700 [Alphaproteobacteria bacterium]|nr:hypothetical protein [Alphaproteobacteria bacterium]